jgi:GNAT superfamily N-acetyltransferase
MSDAAMYQAIEKLRDGRCAVIRAFKPDDRIGLMAAVERASPDTLYRRFFTVKRRFSEKEIDFFMNVDFVEHVALVAVVQEEGRPMIVGAGRYVVVAPGKAELAFAVIDQYQGQGIGAKLMHHLGIIADRAGIKEFVADVLPENAPMQKVFERSGYRMRTEHDSEVVHISLQLA